MKKIPFGSNKTKNSAKIKQSGYRLGRKSKFKTSLEERLRELFAMDRLYTTNDIMRLTGHDKQYVQSCISMIQNSKYYDNPLVLVRRRCKDGIRRIGNPTAEKICEVKHAGITAKTD